MASAAKRPRASKYTREEVLAMLDRDEDHLGMSSDEESKIDRELDDQSEFSR